MSMKGQMQRTGIYLLVILSLVIGTAAVVDAAVVTDRERLEEFVEAVTGKVSDSRIDEALAYADPSKVSMEIVRDGRRHRYNDRNAKELPPDARRALAALTGSRVDLIQENIELDEEHARVALRLRTDRGLANAVFDLRRADDDDWLLRRVTIH